MISSPSTDIQRRVACIGLGAMGAPIAARLIKHGQAVHVWNRTREKATPLESLGACVLPSLSALRDLDIQFVFVNVSDSAALHAVVAGKDGLLDILTPGATVIDNSSVSPEAAREVAATLAARGINFLDAPVTGGTTGAAAGTLTVMVGGDAEIVARCEPLLCAFGSAIHHVGAVGSGQACKLCHQVAAACAMLGLCEGLALAAKAGLPLRSVLDVLSSGSVGSTIVRVQGAKMVARDHSPGFRVDLMRKDLRTAHELSGALELPLPGSELAAMLLKSLSSKGGGDLGWQALIREYEDRAGFSLAQATDAPTPQS